MVTDPESRPSTLNPAPTVATPASRGLVVGMFVCVFFAAVWAQAALHGMPAAYVRPAHITVVVVSCVLLLASVVASRRRRPALQTTGGERTPRRRIWRNYAVTVVIEVGAIIVAANLLPNFHLTQYQMPVIAIIVGLHFFPLGRIFRMRRIFDITAILMTLAGAIAVLAILAGGPATGANRAADIACAIVLWGSGIASLLATRSPKSALGRSG